MLRRPNRRPLDLRPINTLIQRLVHQPYEAHVLAAHHVQPVRYLGRGLAVFWGSDHALDCGFEDLCRGWVLVAV